MVEHIVVSQSYMLWVLVKKLPMATITHGNFGSSWHSLRFETWGALFWSSSWYFIKRIIIIGLTKIYFRVTEFGPVCPQIIPDLSDEQEALRFVCLFSFSNIWLCLHLTFSIFLLVLISIFLCWLNFQCKGSWPWAGWTTWRSCSTSWSGTKTRTAYTSTSTHRRLLAGATQPKCR